MDDATFDRLTRALGVSRRSALKVIAGGAVASIAAIVRNEGAVAKPLKKDDPFYRALKSCRNGEQCGALVPCDPSTRICLPTACRIDGEIYRLGASNPDNFCQFCNATAWSRWTNRHRNETCPDSTGNPCIVDFGTCSDGECLLERVPDGTSCGEQQICCAGICCDAGLSCGPNGACQPFASDPGGGEGGEDVEEPVEDEEDDPPPGDPDPCPFGDCESEEPVCTIGGVEYANGARNPDMDCEFCDAVARPAGWTFVADNTACGEARDRYCCQGICCVPGKCCNQVGLCTSGADYACPELVPQGN